MELIADYYHFLFETPTGVLCLVFGGMLIFAVIAFIAEKRTHMLFADHPEEDDDFWGEDIDDDKPKTVVSSSSSLISADTTVGGVQHTHTDTADQTDADAEIYDDDEDE